MPLSDSQAGMLGDFLHRIGEIRDQIGPAWPYHADPDTGLWDTVDDGDWCGGHWVECLRIKGRLEGKPELIEEALERTEALRPKLEKDDQFRGHRFYYSAARMYAETGDPNLRTLAMAAAYAVRSMAIPQNGAMPIGHEVQVKSTTLASRRIVAVDNVHPNLRLDFWAAKECGDPVFKKGAMAMLDVTIRDFLRDDGSTVEFIEYDQTKDQMLRHFTLLGIHDDSCWSRGQAWAVAGFLRGWTDFGERRYLDAAKASFGYWTKKVGNAVPAWDFDDPDGPLDTSASAIVLEQLARMAATGAGGTEARAFTDRLNPMLEAISAHMAPRGRLVDGCFNRPKRFADHAELIWGTAYLTMALSYLEEGRVPC